MRSFAPQETIETLNTILDIEQGISGIDYLKELLKKIAKAFEIKYVFVGHVIASENDEIQTDVVWGDNGYYDNFIYRLKNTPCENVFSGNRVCIYPKNVADEFPKDKLLVEMGVESYIGAPILKNEGELSGILVFLDDKPVKNADFYTAVIEFLVARVGVELDRFYIEEELKSQVFERTSELEKTNQELRLEIIEREKTELALQESENKLKNIFNTSIPICITNTDYQIVLSNDAYKNIFNLNEQSESPVKCYDSRPGPACHTDACPMKRVLSGEKEVLCEPTKENDDGRKQYFIVTARPFLNREGHINGLVECFQDITSRKNAEIERDNLLEELQNALSKVKLLSGFLPICASCKNIRDDKGYWNQIESYIRDRSEAEFSHGICPDCAKKLYPDLINDNENIIK